MVIFQRKIAAVFLLPAVRKTGGENASNKSDELKGMKQIEEEIKEEIMPQRK